MININSLVVLVLFVIFGNIESQQPYQPIPANVRPIQQLQPIQPPIQAVSSHSGTRDSTRCYICSWTIAQCTDFNCYNNPDICTNNNFSPSLVQQADCPAGCEQFVITDPNGLVQQWRRNCAPGNIPTAGFNCRTEYQLGIRVDRCFCNKDWCNATSHLMPNILVITAFCLITTFILFDFFP